MPCLGPLGFANSNLSRILVKRPSKLRVAATKPWRRSGDSVTRAGRATHSVRLSQPPAQVVTQVWNVVYSVGSGMQGEQSTPHDCGVPPACKHALPHATNEEHCASARHADVSSQQSPWRQAV